MIDISAAALLWFNVAPIFIGLRSDDSRLSIAILCALATVWFIFDVAGLVASWHALRRLFSSIPEVAAEEPNEEHELEPHIEMTYFDKDCVSCGPVYSGLVSSIPD